MHSLGSMFLWYFNFSAIEVGEPREISIDTLSTSKPDAPCRVTVQTPRGQVFELPTERAPEGYRTNFAPIEPGPHKVGVNFAGKEIPKSPFPVTVEPRTNVGAVRVRGLETRKSAHGCTALLNVCVLFSIEKPPVTHKTLKCVKYCLTHAS